MAKPPEALVAQRIEEFTKGAARRNELDGEQVGPAPGQPITSLALEAAVIDWLPGARIPSWPGALGSSNARGRRYVCSPPRSPHRDSIAATAGTTIGGD